MKELDLFSGVYKGKKILVTGDTGFKGSWMCIWLKELGAEVYGYALPPLTEKDNYVTTELSNKIHHMDGDVSAAIERARSFGIRTMMGCMIESSLAVTAAAHLALLCDLADLDAPLLIHNDPFSGLTYRGSVVILPPGSGIGAVRRGGN